MYIVLVIVACYEVLLSLSNMQLQMLEYYITELPSEQLWPIQPSLQEHNPSVGRHVLQLGEQDREQFVPYNPRWQAKDFK